MFRIPNGGAQKLTPTLEQIGKSLLEMMSKEYDELLLNITEADVEKWAKLVDTERKSPSTIDSIDADVPLKV